MFSDLSVGGRAEEGLVMREIVRESRGGGLGIHVS